MTKIFIFNNACRAAGYGIGTYVSQLSDSLSVRPDTKVLHVDMYAETKEFAVKLDAPSTMVTRSQMLADADDILSEFAEEYKKMAE